MSYPSSRSKDDFEEPPPKKARIGEEQGSLKFQGTSFMSCDPEQSLPMVSLLPKSSSEARFPKKAEIIAGRRRTPSPPRSGPSHDIEVVIQSQVGAVRSQTKRFRRCNKNKLLCEVCSKPDCMKCANCLSKSTGRQACKEKPIEKCLSYIKANKSAQVVPKEPTFYTDEDSTSTLGSENSDDALSRTSSMVVETGGISQGQDLNLPTTKSDTRVKPNQIDVQDILQKVASGLSSLSSIFKDAMEKINDIKTMVDSSLQPDGSTQSSHVTSPRGTISTPVTQSPVSTSIHKTNEPKSAASNSTALTPFRRSSSSSNPTNVTFVSTQATSATASFVSTQPTLAIASFVSTQPTSTVASKPSSNAQNGAAAVTVRSQQISGYLRHHPTTSITPSHAHRHFADGTFQTSSASTSIVVQTTASHNTFSVGRTTTTTAAILPPPRSVITTIAQPSNQSTVQSPTPQARGKIKARMKEAFSKLRVNLHITKCGISGPPGTGKSHVKALLMGWPHPSERRSTAVSSKAEEATTADDIINAEERKNGNLKWTVLRKDHWARLLANTIYNCTLPSDSHQTGAIDVSLEEDSDEGCGDLCFRTYTLLKKMYQTKRAKRGRHTMNNIHLIYFVDNGGQPQFQEILPNFVRSSINFFTHKLSEKLTDCPQFEYYIDGQHYSVPEMLRVSNMSIVEQSVRSVCSSIRSERIDKQAPMIAIIGTFKDDFARVCSGDKPKQEELLKEKGDIIKKKLENYVGSGTRKCNMMNLSREQVIFPIDASASGWNSNTPVLEKIRNEVQEYSKKATLHNVPISYFIYLRNMKEYSKRNKKAYLCKSEFQELARNSYICFNEDDIKNALSIFSDVNLILYFPNSSMLHDIVFINPNYLYDRVTELIVSSFHCRGRPSVNNFYVTGIFTDQHLQQVPSLRFMDDPNFTQQMFLSLLQDLFIIARLHDGRYFMPCVLQIENLDSSSLSPSVERQIRDIQLYMDYNKVCGPLVISFGDKMSPRGLFCAMVVKLSKNFGWQLNSDIQSVRRRNMIEFSVFDESTHVRIGNPPPIGTALICDKVTHLEVYTTCESQYCSNVRSAVLLSLYEAGTSLKYSFKEIEVCTGFYCKSCPGSPRHHTTVFRKKDSGKWAKKCSLNTRKRPAVLENTQGVWFENTQIGVSSQAAPISDSLDVIKEIVPNTNKWIQIGLNLELSHTDIERIRIDFNNEETRFTEVFKLWQKRGNPPFTWNTLVLVLETPIVQEYMLATRIKEKYIPQI